MSVSRSFGRLHHGCDRQEQVQWAHNWLKTLQNEAIGRLSQMWKRNRFHGSWAMLNKWKLTCDTASATRSEEVDVRGSSSLAGFHPGVELADGKMTSLFGLHLLWCRTSKSFDNFSSNCSFSCDTQRTAPRLFRICRAPVLNRRSLTFDLSSATSTINQGCFSFQMRNQPTSKGGRFWLVCGKFFHQYLCCFMAPRSFCKKKLGSQKATNPWTGLQMVTYDPNKINYPKKGFQGFSAYSIYISCLEIFHIFHVPWVGRKSAANCGHFFWFASVHSGEDFPFDLNL